MIDRINGSAFVDPTPVLVQLAAGKPGVPPLQVTVWPDWRGAPNEGAALTSVCVLGIRAAHQQIAMLLRRIAALEIAAVESARVRNPADTETVEGAIASAERLDLVLADIGARADAMTLEPPPAAGPSALDLLAVGADAPADASGPTDDGGA